MFTHTHHDTIITTEFDLKPYLRYDRNRWPTHIPILEPQDMARTTIGTLQPFPHLYTGPALNPFQWAAVLLGALACPLGDIRMTSFLRAYKYANSCQVMSDHNFDLTPEERALAFNGAWYHLGYEVPKEYRVHARPRRNFVPHN